MLSMLLFAQQRIAASRPRAEGGSAVAAAGGALAATADGCEALGDGGSELICNEIDGARRARLAGVLRSYLPAHVREHVRCVGGPSIAARGVQRRACVHALHGCDRILVQPSPAPFLAGPLSIA